MYVDLPEDLIERIRTMAAAHNGITEAELLRKAFDALDLQEEELKEIREIERRIGEVRAGAVVTTPWTEIRDASLSRLSNKSSEK
jgi:hypothetical protein